MEFTVGHQVWGLQGRVQSLLFRTVTMSGDWSFPMVEGDATQGSRCDGFAGDSPVTYRLGDDDYSYDVFVSYRHQDPDGPWVRGVLVERLHAAGLRVFVDYQSFRLGAPLVLEMARGVEQSRYTLAVLSPAYLASNFAELENVLAEHLGLELSQRRLLAVRRVPCKPRLGMRARLWLDMTSDDEVDRNLPRLVAALREPALP
jgi:hypothetical protein